MREQRRFLRVRGAFPATLSLLTPQPSSQPITVLGLDVGRGGVSALAAPSLARGVRVRLQLVLSEGLGTLTMPGEVVWQRTMALDAGSANKCMLGIRFRGLSRATTRHIEQLVKYLLEQESAVMAHRLAVAEHERAALESFTERAHSAMEVERLASIGQLATGLAHEINNHLTIMSGEAQLFLEKRRGQDAEAERVLTTLVGECRRTADLARGVLRFAKPSTAELALVDARRAVEDAVRLAAHQISLKQIQVIREFPEALPLVRGNLHQLQEVALNLILNACQAMRGRGTLRLAARTAAARLEVEVADTGPGIPAARHHQIFQPFYTTKSTGTGLGLFVAQRIITSYGGEITVRSAVGRGATFTIRLPLPCSNC